MHFAGRVSGRVWQTRGRFGHSRAFVDSVALHRLAAMQCSRDLRMLWRRRDGCPGALPGQEAFRNLLSHFSSNGEKDDFPSIVQEDEDQGCVLREVAKEVPAAMFGSTELRELSRKMIHIMREAPGVGLAAPQIAVGLKVIVAEDKEEYMERVPKKRLDELQRQPFGPVVLCNPRLTAVGKGGYRYWEGCLSVGGYQAMVDRYTKVKVDAQDIEGKPISFTADGWQARILQHEVDHVCGVLYRDRAVAGSFMPRKAPSEAEEEVDASCGPCTCSHRIQDSPA